MEGQLLMTRKEAAEALNMSLSHFQRHVQSRLPSVCSGHLRRYRPADLERWIDDQLQLDFGTVAQRSTGTRLKEANDQFILSFEDAHEKFIKDCRAGVALNNRGEAYKAKAIKSLDCGLGRVPASIRQRELVDIAGAELQEAVDEYLREGLSSSRIHTIICAVRSLFAWAIQRGKAAASPATNLRLPAVTYEDRDRIATPGEFADLLECVPDEDALAWALAGYATARHQEIEALGWEDVEFTEDALLLAGDEDARKSQSARRLVPMVSQLRARLYAEWVRQGRPKAGPVFPVKRSDNRTGSADLNATLRRIKKLWEELGKEPITFQDSRHTAATWLDHAGVSPKVSSIIMGHKAPKPKQYPGAAPITLRIYTHMLEGELERAGEQLEGFLAEREAEESEASAQSDYSRSGVRDLCISDRLSFPRTFPW